MLAIQVALVRFDEHVPVEESELLHVAAALQTQIVRDVTPIWGGPMTVCAFSTLSAIPPGWIPLVLTRERDDASYPEGFHLTAAGQPLAIVQYSDGWSFRVSHELIEMVVDPFGHRTAPGPSLADEQWTQLQGTGNQKRPYPEQHEVQYLVEVCDPCQTVHYEINGVPVSDFVTPEYYTLPAIPGARYSFTRRVTQPLQLLEGGYVSWLTRLPDAHVFQAFAPLKDEPGQPVEVTNLRIEPYSGLPPAPAFSREWMDHQPEPASRPTIPSPSSLGSTARFPYEPSASARRYGATLRTEIAAIEAASPQPQQVPTLAQVRTLLRSLATDRAFYDEFKNDPGAKLAEIGVREPIALLSPEAQDQHFPSQEEYQQFLDQLDRGERFGSYFGDPLEASALSVLAVLARS